MPNLKSIYLYRCKILNNSVKFMETYKNYPVYYAEDIKNWINWLKKHWQNTLSVFLIIYKKYSGVPSITYDVAVDVALFWLGR